MLFGIKHDQQIVDFSLQQLRPLDAILIASDVAVSVSLTGLKLDSSRIGPEGGVAIAEALKVNAGSLTRLDFSEGDGLHQGSGQLLLGGGQ
tara:strand:+ start:912 stop:1184 length:273 start_codon:yes stop_codon:yes gene_type:complete|eukprot:scaffold10387_cov81-Phaeocystis_antarctica.AAC.3